MEPLAQLSKKLPDPSALRELADYLSKKYALIEMPTESAEITFLDSFDWRLYKKNRLCFLEDSVLHLTDFTDKQITPPLPLNGALHRFWQRLPQAEIRKELSGILEMRALLPQTEFSRTVRELRILNKDEKTVALILLTKIDTGDENENSLCAVQLREIRGYHKWFLKLSRTLEKFGEPRPCTGRHIFKLLLEHGGRMPLDYSSGFSVELKSDMDSRSAAKLIYRHLLTAMRRNEQGIFDDIDSEFLHDFRVAIRRTRSGLALIKNVLEEEISDRFKEEFRYLGRITGAVRDLDVYLLMEEDYKARLPEHLQKGLHYFFEDLADRRTGEKKKLVRKLGDQQYRTIVRDWREYLDLDQEDTEQQEQEEEVKPQPIGPKANKIIIKRFDRVLRDGRAIDAASPDEDLHRLRIQGKKLRYALEFFTSLYPKKKMKQLVRQLKLLQNNLGLFNDLSVQQDMLNQYLDDLQPNSVKAKKMGAAIGGLLSNLHHEQRLVRTEFEQTFSQFDSRENLALYSRLFKTEGRQKK